jgi:hypothetical protein
MYVPHFAMWLAVARNGLAADLLEVSSLDWYKIEMESEEGGEKGEGQVAIRLVECLFNGVDIFLSFSGGLVNRRFPYFFQGFS